ncbi:MAG: cytochrome ubiquinol oxidase subunit I, partial [Alcaligenaceae bacterium]|nr:cytochrome ubiquinol oxidase subunit I [Alcaligenaceae bacterium]
WYTTEVGRQPWVVYGVMRTADAVSPHRAFEVGLTLLLFIVVYFILFGAGTVYMLRLIKRGPPAAPDYGPEGGPGEVRTPSRPLSAATEAGAGYTVSRQPARGQGDKHGY